MKKSPLNAFRLALIALTVVRSADHNGTAARCRVALHKFVEKLSEGSKGVEPSLTRL